MKESFVLLAGVVKPLREWLLWCFKEEEAMAWRRKNGEKERERKYDGNDEGKEETKGEK
jgi:hypothetical protein